MATATFAACVHTVCQASSVTDAVAGHFITPGVGSLLVAKANVLALYMWDGSDLRLVSETVLPSRVITMATVPLSSEANAATVDCVAMMFSETLLSIGKWNSETHTWTTVAAYVLSPSGATTTPCVSERSTGLPPLLRVDVSHKIIVVLTHRQYAHVIVFPVVKSSLRKGIAAPADDDDGWADERSENGDDNAEKGGGGESGEVPLNFAPVIPFEPAMFDMSLIGTSNIRDLVFMCGTSEPTLAVLREAEPTWAGRVKLLGAGGTKLRALSCGVTFVRLSCTVARTTAQSPSVSPLVVSTAEGLPFDSISLCAVPSPLGGVLLLAASSLAHLSRHGEHYGICFNKHALEMTSADRSDVRWSAAQWCGSSVPGLNFFEGATLVELQHEAPVGSVIRWLIVARDSGIVFEFTARHDGSSVTDATVARIAPLVQAHSAALISRDVLFLASDVTDCVLVSLAAAAGAEGDTAASAYKLRVLTTLPTIGPVTDFEIIDSTTIDAFDAAADADDVEASNPFADVIAGAQLLPKPEPPSLKDVLSAVSLAVCGGRGDRHGGLTILNRHARAEAVLRRVIDCVDIFTYSSTETSEDQSTRKRGRDADAPSIPPAGETTSLVLMATTTATIVVFFGNDTPRQVGPTESGFILDKRTIASAALEHPSLGKIALQFAVDSNQMSGAVAACSLHTMSALQNSPYVLEKAVKHAVQVAPTSVVVLDMTGGLHLIRCDDDGRLLISSWLELPSPITAMCTLPTRSAGTVLCIGEPPGDAAVIEVDGDSGAGRIVGIVKLGFSTMPRSIADDGAEPVTRIAHIVKKPSNPPPAPTVISAVAAALRGSRDTVDCWVTLALLRSDGQLVVYRVTLSDSTNRHQFVKLLTDTHDVLPPQASDTTIAEKKLRKQITGEGATHNLLKSAAKLVYVSRLGSMDAILVPGRSAKIIVSERGMARIHPLGLPDDPSVSSFAPLNYAQCENGFVSASPTQVLFASLVDDAYGVDLRAPWPRTRVSTMGTPHKIAYNATLRGVLVATSRLEPFRPTRAPFDAELDVSSDPQQQQGAAKLVTRAALKAVAASEGIPVPMAERYSIKLYSARSWKHADTVELEENETVVDMASCNLRPKLGSTSSSNAKVCDVTVVGTAFLLGEDHPCRGRVLAFAVSSVNGNKKLVRLASENTKGPVTAVSCLHGYIVVAVGAAVRLMELDWQARRLRTLSFVHIPAFVTSISVFKNYIVAGDLKRSLVVIQYEPGTRTLSIIGSDPTIKDSLAVGAVFGNARSVAVVSYDAKDNVQLFTLHPAVSSTGDVLATPMEPVSHYKLSGTVRQSLRIRHVNSSRSALKETAAELFVTAEGEIGYITPVTEASLRPMRWIASRMTLETERPFALHPAQCRQGTLLNETLVCGGHVCVDTRALLDFIELSDEERRCIATRAGMTAERAMKLLVGIQSDHPFF